ncbi:arylsulfatase B-like [Gigantopelta aegis]|uniref:arylsulfatase B-like n=1 Tax=Gigantopelta aegis TaxID=1735272 RepID=UPI001B88B488|nr:arylsulfatase B-like [Gigantopelta aegis]
MTGFSDVARVFLIVAVVVARTGEGKQPHILFIVADDLGWNDVGWRNPSMHTPNIDKLARHGVVLNSSYVQPVCSPSRTAFMTGIYPFRAGMQHYVIEPSQAVCVPLNFTFLPQELKKLGYSTHAIGKWHLGFCSWECTPTFRGFDSYFGYYNGAEDYYTHKTGLYLDYRDGLHVADSYTGQYSAYTFAKRAQDIIKTHNQSRPLFLYLPFQSVHAPIQVPKIYERWYQNVNNKGRREFSGMVSALDEAIGNITDSLRLGGMMEDTLIVFTADNGGEMVFYANNWPLRGGKHTVWEGGTRGSAFIHGAGLKKTGYTYDGIIHAVDWMPTLLSAAGGHVDEVPGIDGVSQWDSIRTGGVSKRSEFVYNLDDFFIPTEGHSAIRMGDLKLIEGFPGLYDGWYRPMNGTVDTPLMSNVWRANDTRVWLFNVKDDPTERVNLADKMPGVVSKMKSRLAFYRKKMVPANFPPLDPKANPKRFGGVWTPGWC